MIGLTWIRKRKRRIKSAKTETRTRTFGERLDGAITALFPTWGLKRKAARAKLQVTDRLRDAQLHRIERLKHSWDGAKTDRLRGHRWLASGLSPDAAAKEDLETLQENAVELYRNSTTAHSAIEGRVANEIGVGITPQARINAKELGWTPDQAKEANRQVEDVIQRWSDHGVDKKRILSLQMFIRQVGRCFATYGEAFVEFGQSPFRGPIGLALNLISPERIETPPEEEGNERVRLGIQYDQNDQVVGYWVRSEHPGDELAKHQYDFVSRFYPDGNVRMVHVFDPLFPEQSRGIPWLAAAINRIKDLDDFFEAELINKQIEACFGLIIKGGEGASSPQDQAEGAADETLSSGDRIEEIEPGMVQYLADGQEATTVDPNRPGSTFAPFVEQAMRSIAAALNYPYELLAKNFFRTTFSSGRLAGLDGRMGFLMRRSVLIDLLLKPLYREILFDAMFMGEVQSIDLLDYRRRPWAYERHKWQGQAWGLIDPEKEIKAHALANEKGIMTKSDIHAEQGKDFDEQHDQRTVEMRREVEQEVEIRAYRRDLEEQNGLPPSEVEATDETEEADEPEPVGAGADD